MIACCIGVMIQAKNHAICHNFRWKLKGKGNERDPFNSGKKKKRKFQQRFYFHSNHNYKDFLYHLRL